MGRYRPGSAGVPPALPIRRNTAERRGSVYEVVRKWWRLKPGKAGRADYVLAVVGGVCEGVFVVGDMEETRPLR